jgi:O-antigen/teichoic acid export membrane protein
MRRHAPDLALGMLLLLLPLILFSAQTLGGRTLLPTENLFQYEPYASYREVVGAPALPHNALLSDLVLQNYPWKSFIRQSLAQGEFPLWNPHQFAGIPFFAAGQQSTLYPFNLLYLVLPLPVAYGWFTVVQLWLAGLFLYALLRGLGVSRAGSVLGGVVYQLSGFFVASAVFPMMIAAAVWIPLLLLMIEYVIRQRQLGGQAATIPWVIGGAIALGCNILAGHVEITYYLLLVGAFYTVARLLPALLGRQFRHTLERAAWLLGMIALGLGLGAVQFIPLFEFASLNYRDGRSTLDQILGWAHPPRDVLQYLLPNLYGNPAHHGYWDVFSGQWVNDFTNLAGQPIQTIDWGIKNYVEGALYVGILPLLLSLYALLDSVLHRREAHGQPPYRVIFGLLTGIALSFMFGLPTYALLYYGFPGINQLHSPFRWVLVVTLGIAVLAGFGLDGLGRQGSQRSRRFITWGTLAAGGVLLLGLLAARVGFGQIEPLLQRLVEGLARAGDAFSGARMFFSYLFPQILLLAVILLGIGGVLWVVGRTWTIRLRGQIIPLWQPLAITLVALDVLIATWNFNPASDPALLDFTPPAIQWLQQQTGDWRFTAVDAPELGERGKVMNANIGWRYGLDDIRGYESIIPRQYVNFMESIAPQTQLGSNRVAPFYADAVYEQWGHEPVLTAALQSPLLDQLNVRYVMTIRDFTLPVEAAGWQLAYEDEAVRIWENPDYARGTASRLSVVSLSAQIADSQPQAMLLQDTGREKLIAVEVPLPDNRLIIRETYLPGWRAFIRPAAGTEQDEQPLEVSLHEQNFQMVTIPDAGAWVVRVVYSPLSFQVGLFASFLSGLLLLFLGGIALWGRFVNPRRDTANGAQTIARNSLAPIILNLFNRGIDFAFAIVMLRILGPEGSGIYAYAGFIFMWFDIFTNFGLNVFLTREVSRDLGQSWRLFFNSSVLRLLLIGAGVVLFGGFVLLRQGLPGEGLTSEAILAMILLYIGLLPNSLSAGMSALFYAHQQAEYPAAIATVSTICKTVFGLMALLLGWGVIGLAGVSILTNSITLLVMLWSGRRLFRQAAEPTTVRSWRAESPLLRGMVGAGWPLMLNHFLATIFFQIDVLIIQFFHGDAMVGLYNVAYKWLSALNVIPAFFTMALLPLMSRQAKEDPAALKRNYGLGIKLLFSLAVPIAICFTFLAWFLTEFLGGREFLPDGAIATQLMIWSIPIGWMNSLTQYVLIALDLQRRITWAFGLAVSFNIISNLVFVPIYGYQAAALTTIASEALLLIPFALLLRGALGALPWARWLWRTGAAGALLFGCLWVLWPVQPLLALVLGLALYAGVWLALRPFSTEEWDRLQPLMPKPITNYLARGKS